MTALRQVQPQQASAVGGQTSQAVLAALSKPKPEKKVEPEANGLLSFVIDKAAQRQRKETAPERAKAAVVTSLRPKVTQPTPEPTPDPAPRPRAPNPLGDEAAETRPASTFELTSDQDKVAAARRILESGAMGKHLRKDEIDVLAAEADTALDAIQTGEAKAGAKVLSPDPVEATPAEPRTSFADLNSSILAALAGKAAASSFTGEASDVTKPAPTLAEMEAAARAALDPVAPQLAVASEGAEVSAEPKAPNPGLSDRARKIFDRLEATDDGQDNWMFAGL